MNLKNIHIGELIKKGVEENRIEISRICNFLKCTEDDVEKMYQQESLDTETVLKWSKLIDYDFFRVYTQHLFFCMHRLLLEEKTKNIRRRNLHYQDSVKTSIPEK